MSDALFPTGREQRSDAEDVSWMRMMGDLHRHEMRPAAGESIHDRRFLRATTVTPQPRERSPPASNATCAGTPPREGSKISTTLRGQPADAREVLARGELDVLDPRGVRWVVVSSRLIESGNSLHQN